MNLVTPPKKVVFGTPSLDKNVSCEYLVAMISTREALRANGILPDLSLMVGDCFIGKARNHIVTKFMESDAEALFFIDADQGWSPHDVIRLLLDPHDIVAGVVPKKADIGNWAHVFLDHDERFDCYLENGCLRAKACGTGFMRIKRSAIERYIDAYPDIYKPGDGSLMKYHYELFSPGVVGGEFWGEDIGFCNKWRAIGGEIWIDPNCSFKHVGIKSYEGNYLEHLQKTVNVQMIPLAA